MGGYRTIPIANVFELGGFFQKYPHQNHRQLTIPIPKNNKQQPPATAPMTRATHQCEQAFDKRGRVLEVGVHAVPTGTTCA
jgi:type IV pilus biogenesis protein CpaD/CtpE